MSKAGSRRTRQSLKDRAAHWERAYRMADGMSKWQGERLRDLESVLDDVKHVVGDMSSLLPVTSVYHGRRFMDRRSTYRVPHMGLLPPLTLTNDMPGDMPGDMVMTIMDIPVMLMEIGEDKFRGMVHVRLDFDDKTSAYAISRKALATMSPERLEMMVRQVFMPELARHLVKHAKGL